ncbi:MAG: AMP-binding protein [Actinomycetota bacterium]|nr:AMP-binding protein [Actinomycetota bacterium]
MGYVWSPSEEYLEHCNVARLMQVVGVHTIDELRSRSVADIASFWDTVVADLGVEFRVPYRQVLDLDSGIAYPEWFVGGGLNVVDTCLRRWARDTPDAVAVRHETEGGTVRRLTYGELHDQVARARAGLQAHGIVAGDPVALYLPMIPEAIVAMYAIASLGAMIVPLFSGFAATAIAARVEDAGAKAVITANGFVRRGKEVRMFPVLSDALAACPTVDLVVVVQNGGEPAELGTSGAIGWDELVAATPGVDVAATSASDVLLLAYTSGTTGKPKGAVHTQAGFLLKVASEVAYGFDVSPGRTFCWITDMGWIMGPLSVFGTHACGGTLLLYEGSPDVPDLNRLWHLVERHRIATLGVSPTLIRLLRGAAGGPPTADLSSLRVIGSTGEPWDPESYEWLAHAVLGGRVPIINFSGGTEVGGSFLSPYPVEKIRSCSLGGPSLGMDVDVVDEYGNPIRGSIGELVCRQPWPAMTRSIWNDDQRYQEAYWSTYPGMWHHGDHALVDSEGSWFVLGRSDDVMNIAGKRVAPAEIESVLTADSAVAEAAVVGIPDPSKGEAVWAFWVASATAGDDGQVAQRLRTRVADEVGKPFMPTHVVHVAALPKTRSAKILRRVLRAAVLGSDPGDLSGAENPEAAGQISAVVAQLGLLLHPD